jgi:endonuclease VIII
VPEGDTVWLTAHRLDQALRGRPVRVFDLRVPQLATADLRGDTVTAVLARGKHLLTRFASGITLHSHLRMDGSWYLTRAGLRARRRPEHEIRALVGNDDWLATGYRVHDLRLVATEAEGALVGHLGPDLLGPDWDPAEAVRRLRERPERPVGEALLDQRNLAGIGNMYKSEALFLTGLHPERPVGDVRDLDGLVQLAQRLLAANRDHPMQSTTGLTQRGAEHWVYERAGQPCRRCRTPIRRATHGSPPQQRLTFWCPGCQPA